MGSISSSLIERLIVFDRFIAVGFGGMDNRQKPTHGALYVAVGAGFVGNIDKGYIVAVEMQRLEFGPVQAIGFAYAAAHGNAVDGFTEPFFGNGNENFDARFFVVAASVFSP